MVLWINNNQIDGWRLNCRLCWENDSPKEQNDQIGVCPLIVIKVDARWLEGTVVNSSDNRLLLPLAWIKHFLPVLPMSLINCFYCNQCFHFTTRHNGLTSCRIWLSERAPQWETKTGWILSLRALSLQSFLTPLSEHLYSMIVLLFIGNRHNYIIIWFVWLMIDFEILYYYGAIWIVFTIST